MTRRKLIDRLTRRHGDIELAEPRGVEYTVRDEDGRVVEIVLEHGRRIYVGTDEDAED
jgi:hypothetical protein